MLLPCHHPTVYGGCCARLRRQQYPMHRATIDGSVAQMTLMFMAVFGATEVLELGSSSLRSSPRSVLLN